MPRLSQLACFASTVFFTASVFANPVLDHVSAGSATVQQTQSTTVVNQSSQRAVINWQSFNIGANESTHFQQPTGGVALNRISGSQGASQIYGRLTATGQIILVNPAGIYFGPSAYVNVGGLVAATANLSDQDFMSGNYKFTNATALAGSVINEGTIIASQHGLVALVGSAVSNKGTIQADLGKVVLASGEAFTMSFAGNDMISFTIDSESTKRGRDQNGNELSDGISNTGSIIAHGGSVMVTARAASGVLNNVINLAGVVEVKSVSQKNGVLILSGDPNNGVVRVAGRVDASGKQVGEKGGSIDITGYNILLADGSLLDVSGDRGGGNINIGGNYQGVGPLPHANALVMTKNATILADAITSGHGGQVVLWSDYATKAYGNISAQGGALSGDGGLIETSSKGYLDIGGISINLRAAKGKTGNWLLDPADLTICSACTTTAILTGDIFEPNGTNSNLLVDDLIAQLAGANITVQTTAAGVGGNGDIFVNADINYNSANSLTLTAFRNIEINNAINNSGSGGLTFNSSGTTNVNTTSAIQAGGDVVFNNNVVLTQNSNLSSTAGALNFLGTINGANQLTASGSSVTFSQAIGNSTPLSSLSVSGATNINGGAVTTTGSQTYNGAVLLGAATTINTTNSNVLFNSTLNTVSGQNLTINAGSGDITFNGNIGAISFQPGVTNLNSTGTTTFNGTSNYFTSLTTNAGGTTHIANGGIFSAINAITINDSLLVGNTTTNMQISSGGIITLNGTVNGDGAGGLQAEAFGTGQVIINNLIGNITAPTLFGTQGATTINTSSITAGFQFYVNAVTLNSNSTLTAGGFGFGGSSSVNGAFDLTLAGGGSTSIGNIGNITPLNSLTINGSVQSSGSIINTVGNISVTGSVFNLGNDLAITSSAGSITLPSITATVGNPRGITLNGNTGVTFGNNVGSVSTPLTYLTVNGATTITGIGGEIRTSGTQTYNSAVTLDQNVDMISSAGSIIFANTLNGQRALTLNANSSVTFGGAVGGTDALSSLNVTGATNFNGGSIRTSGAQTYNSAITLGSNTTITNTGANNVIFNSTINGSHNLSIDNAGTTRFNGAVGAITPLTSFLGSNNGIIEINGGTLATSGAQTYSNNTTTIGAAAILSGVNITFNSIFRSANATNFDITINDSGTTTFNAAVGGQAFSSFTTDAAGTTVLNGGSIATTGNLTINDTLSLGATNAFLSSTTGNINLATVNGNGIGLTIQNSGVSTTSTISGVLSGTGTTLTKNGSGTLVLNASNTYTGGTVINSGTLRLSGSGNLLSTGSLNIAGGTFDLNGINQTIGFFTGSGNVTLGSATLTVGDATSGSYSGVISGSGGLTKQGSSLLTLTGAHSYTGATTINDGTLRLSSTGRLSDTTAVTVGPSGTFSMQVAADTIGSLSGSGSVVLAGTLTTGDTSNTTFSGVISGGGGLTKQGSGTFTLTGANTYTGLLTVSAGTLVLSGAGQLDSTIAATINGTLNLDSVNQTFANISGTGNIIVGGGILTLNTGSNNAFSGVISGSGSLIKDGAAFLQLAGSNTYTGTTTINNGILRLTGAGRLSDLTAVTVNAGGTLDLNNVNDTIGSLQGAGNLTLTGSSILTTGDATNTLFSGVISGSGGLVKQGSGIFTLSGTNTYTGTTTINAGSILANNSQSLGTSAGGTIVNSGATLTVAGVSIADALTLNDATLAATGATTLTGAINLGTATSNNITSASSLVISQNVNGGGSLSTSGAGTTTFNGNLGNSTALSSINTGANTVINGSVTTSGGQTFANVISLTANRTFTSTAGNIVFNNTIDGGFDLTVNSAGGITFGSALGAGTTLNSLTANGSSINLNGGAVTTSGSQTYNGALSLGSDTTLSTTGSGSNTIAINSGVSGNQNLTLAGAASSSDTFILSSSIGVNNLVVSGGAGGNDSLSVNSGGTQTFTVIANNAGVITGVNGVTGTASFSDIQNLTGGSGNDNFVMNAGTSLSGAVNGGSGTNSLSLTNGTATWTVNATNAGTLTNLGGGFSNIQNLIGGASSDTFIISGGGSVSSINGGGGANSLSAANGANNTFNITGSNTGSLTSYVNSFSNIQSLTGSSAANSFVFADNASVSGLIDGGSDTASNTLSYTAYNSNINVALGTIVGDIFDGTITNHLGATISSFQNIGTINTNTTQTNTITLPNKSNTLFVTGSAAGYINDPLFFSGFTQFTAPGAGNIVNVTVPASINLTNNTVTINGVTMTFNNFTINGAPAPTPTSTTNNAAQIVQQPSANSDANGPVVSGAEWILTGNVVSQDLSQMLNQITEDYEAQLNKTKINPYCFAGS